MKDALKKIGKYADFLISAKNKRLRFFQIISVATNAMMKKVIRL